MALRPSSTQFKEEASAETTKPIWLYEITLPNSTVLYYTNRSTQVLYPLGDVTEKTYLSRPISHESLSENLDLQADAIPVTIGNADREMVAFLEANNGLVDCQVVVKVVHEANIATPNSHISQTLLIDYSDYDTNTHDARIILTSRLNLMQVRIPLRDFNRDFCPWKYKELGCYEDDGAGNPVKPDLFFTDEGYPFYPDPAKTVDDWDDDGYLDIVTTGLNCVAIERTINHHFVCKIYPDPVSKINANSYIFIGNDPDDLTDGWKYSDLTALNMNDAQWNLISIPLSSFSVEGTGLDLTTVSFVRIFSDQTGWTDFKVKEIFLEVFFAANSPYFVNGNPDTCSNVHEDCVRHGPGALRQAGYWRYLPREGTAYYV